MKYFKTIIKIVFILIILDLFLPTLIKLFLDRFIETSPMGDSKLVMYNLGTKKDYFFILKLLIYKIFLR